MIDGAFTKTYFVVKIKIMKKNIDSRILDSWQIDKKEKAFATPWFEINKYSCVTPTNVAIPEYFVHTPPDSVIMVCITEDGKVLLERQWRLPIMGISLDFPAGAVEDTDENTEAAAKRELLEETGYISNEIEFLFSINKDPGFSSGKSHVFLARNAKLEQEPTDKNELVVLELMTPKELLAAIENDEMPCSLCLSTALRVAIRLGWIGVK